MMTSKAAFSPSPSERPENSGLTPIIGAVGGDRQRELRSTARPPGSAMRTVTCASSGRVVAGSLSSVTRELGFAVRVGLRQVLERLAPAVTSSSASPN